MTTQLLMMVMMMSHSNGGQVTNQTKSLLLNKRFISGKQYTNGIHDIMNYTYCILIRTLVEAHLEVTCPTGCLSVHTVHLLFISDLVI